MSVGSGVNPSSFDVDDWTLITIDASEKRLASAVTSGNSGQHTISVRAG
jgi:hypothetical protein